MDDLLTNSLKFEDHVNNLRVTFDIMRKYNMKLNQEKCSSGVSQGKFLCLMVKRRGIEVNPGKIYETIKRRSPKNVKDVQQLTDKIDALNSFLSRASDKCKIFSCH